MSKRRLSKTKRNRQDSEQDYLLNTKFGMRHITPITDNQRKFVEAYENGGNVLAIGSPGTGKTFLSLNLALKDVMTKDELREVIIFRSAVQSRNQGFMPGNGPEKMSEFEAPYIDMVNELFDRGDAYQILKQKRMIRFMSTSFIRGMTFDNAVLIADECQNMNYGELKTILTRAGKNSRMIYCGDTKQDDLTPMSKNRNDISGLKNFKMVLDTMEGYDFKTVKFTHDDIVRSELVKAFIIAEELLDLQAA